MSAQPAPATDRFRRARDRGGRYLLRQVRPDGGFGPVERGLASYYKAPQALTVCGASAQAGRLCDWIRRHGFGPQGDFGPRIAETVGYYYLYYNAWVVIGVSPPGPFRPFTPRRRIHPDFPRSGERRLLLEPDGPVRQHTAGSLGGVGRGTGDALRRVTSRPRAEWEPG